MKKKPLSLYAWLSVVAVIVTILLKTSVYFYTNSVGLLSDALESIINLAAAILAVWMIKIAERPPDDNHEFGHDKAEYFSSGIEGTLITLAALGIIVTAVPRLFSPQPVENIGIGLSISFVAALINLIVGQILIKVGKENDSIVLEADGHHLMTDVWTSVGIFVAIGVVALTDWFILDPFIALIVAVNISWMGYKLIRRSVLGLMDTVIDVDSAKKATEVLNKYKSEIGIDYHAFRTRKSGARKFIYFHLLVPDEWTVKKGHDLAEEIELKILQKIPHSAVFIHLEPLEDPTSFNDVELFR
ncbi:MAG: cation diffusion facilitator family transporter [Acidobacteriota bacterium]|nr:cation diffusion facilitator family transporter [Acidobacteriota bacterium]